jgi:hypothetical protein
MPSLVQEYREKLEKRAKELRPLVAELEEIEQALASFPKSSQSRSQVNGRGPSTRRPRRRRARRGQRSEQVIAAVRANPGSTGSQIASQLSVKPTSLYQVSSRLVAEGKLKKNGTKYTVKR